MLLLERYLLPGEDEQGEMFWAWKPPRSQGRVWEKVDCCGETVIESWTRQPDR